MSRECDSTRSDDETMMGHQLHHQLHQLQIEIDWVEVKISKGKCHSSSSRENSVKNNTMFVMMMSTCRKGGHLKALVRHVIGGSIHLGNHHGVIVFKGLSHLSHSPSHLHPPSLSIDF